MLKRTRYYVADTFIPFCALMDIDPARVLARANLPTTYHHGKDQGLLPHQVFALWSAGAEEYGKSDFSLRLGKALVHGPFVSTIFAYTCSATVETGLERLAIFKPLVGPIALDITKTDASLTITIRSTVPSQPLPDCVAAMDLVFFAELIRSTTGADITPLSATLPTLPDSRDEIEAHLGIPIKQGGHTAIEITRADAQRPLTTENPSLWAYFEKDLRAKLNTHTNAEPITDRTRSALFELLPSGHASAEAACRHLGLSKRSLQRHLKSEGTTFQAILDATRSELSLHYLRKDDLSVEEISYLLAYRDPNSFYRAFNNWTGMTPAQARVSQMP